VASDERRLGRREDAPLLRGAGCFVGDVRLDGLAHLAVVRSPVAAARIRSVDLHGALALPGVLDAFSLAELERRPGAIPPRIPIPSELEPLLQPALADGIVRYPGQAVAAVVATSPELAVGGAERVALDLVAAPLPEPETVHVHADAFGDVDAVFATAPVVVRERFDVARQGGMPLEPRGTIAAYDRDAGRLVLWLAAKAPNHARAAMAAMLGLAGSQVELRLHDLGGGFGVRGELHPEDVVVALASLRLGRPVRWLETRSEHLLASYQSRGQSWEAAVALDLDGTILGLDATVRSDLGAFLGPNGITVGLVVSKAFLGPYRPLAYRCRVDHVRSAKVPLGTMRGPAYVEAVLARERLVDRAAAEVGLDPIAIRRRNLVPADAMPYDTGLAGVVLDGGDYEAALDAAIAGVESVAPGRDATAGRVATGVAVSVEASGTPAPEQARARLGEDGRIAVEVASRSFGQGHETTLARVAARALGVPEEHVGVVEGPTDWDGGGTFASRTAMMTGSAVHEAALALRELIDAGQRAPLEALGTFQPEAPTYTYGAAAARVAVDPETGSVHVDRIVVVVDAGRALDRAVVLGQLLGGAAQGLGCALQEAVHRDDEGNVLTYGLRDYLVPTALDCAAIEAIVLEWAPSPRNPLGARGVGEIAVSLAAAALANAVSAAGRDVRRLPVLSADLVGR